MDKNDFRAKVILLIIGISNIILILLQGGISYLISQIFLSIMLFKCNSIARLLFILGSVLGAIFSFFTFRSGDYIYATYIMLVCVFTFYSLTLNNNVKTYIENAKKKKESKWHINYKHLILFLMFFSLFSFSSINTYRRSGLVNIAKVDYKSNVEEFHQLFPFLEGVDKCYWKIGLNNDYSFMQRFNTIRINGYIQLDDEFSEILSSSYKWSDDNIAVDYRGNPYFKDDLLLFSNTSYVSTNVMGIENLNWKYNKEFSETVNQNGYDIYLYFDQNKKIIYFIGIYSLN